MERGFPPPRAEPSCKRALRGSPLRRAFSKLRSLSSLRQGKTPWLVGVFLAAAISAAQYGPTLAEPFEYGDRSQNRSDTALMLGRLRGGLGPSDMFGAWPAQVYWRPVTMLWHVAEYSLWGERPFFSRLTGLLLHIGVLTLIMVVVWKASRSRAAALVAMLAYAVLGEHGTAVVWICARAELLCALFYLAAIAAFLSAGKGWLWSLPFAALALGAKEMAVSLPLVASAWAIALRRRDRLIAAACLWALLAAYILLRFKILGLVVAGTGHSMSWRSSLTMYSSFIADPVVALLQAPRAFPFDLSLVAYPPFWVFVLRETVFWFAVYVLVRRCAGPAAAFFLWKAIAYLPVIRYVTDLETAWHYLYLPDIGNSMLLGLVAATLWDFARGKSGRRIWSEEGLARSGKG